MHSLLENYLAHLEANLTPLPKRRREDEIKEMRLHLSSAYKAELENSKTEDDAAKAAIEQFGSPETVARDTVLAWRRSGDTSAGAFWGVVGIVWLIFNAMSNVGYSINLYWQASSHMMTPIQDQFLAAELIIASLATIVVSALIGMVFPKNAVLAIATAGVVSALLMLVNFVGTYLYMKAHQGYGAFESVEPVTLVAIQLAKFFVAALIAWPVSRWREDQLRLTEQVSSPGTD